MTYRMTGLFLAFLFAAGPASARRKPAQAPEAVMPQVPQLAAEQRVLHAISRLSFGARPGDVERVQKLGVERWIEQQLYPESIPLNPVLEDKLAPLETLRLDPRDLVSKYPPPQMIKAMAEGRLAWPEEPETRHLVQKLAAEKCPASASDLPQPPPLDARQRELFESNATPDKIALLASLPAEKQLDVLSAIPEAQRRRLFASAPPDLRRKIELFRGTQTVVNQDLFAGKLLRATYSDRQLEEVLTDFWFNHFNVYLDKGADRYLVTSYERDVIRPHVLGRFQDLLLATAESPAMLFYLDNFQSAGPDAPNQANSRRKTGLNENYGRELLELHTLGVDGGYTQQDVTAAARCFTGWTIREPRRGGGFEFRIRQHDQGEKQFLGVTIPPGGGMDDGLRVIEILSRHPSTARFISRSLAIRFVSDTPPASLVERMASTFLSTGGDLREVMRTLFRSPEFWSPAAYRAKLKSPLEMVVSALRATNADVDFTFALAQQLNTLGEPLYRKQEPTGYSNLGSDWMNSASLLARMNFALALANNKVAGVKVLLPANAGTAQLGRTLLMTDLSPATREAIDRGLAGQSSAPTEVPSGTLAAGLILGSPDFQRR